MSRLIILAIALLSATSGVYLASAQQSDDEEVRGAFLSTRPKTTNANAPAARRRRPPQRNTNSSPTGAKNANTEKAPSSTNSNNSFISNPAKVWPSSIALGYTIFMRDVNGRAVRVDP